MAFELERSVEILERTPAALQALLGGVSDFWVRSDYGEATFSPFDVVGHLIHRLRARSLDEVRALGLTPERLELPGAHPQLGPVTFKHLLAAWVVHDLGHLHQVAKAMAYQYRDEVGPWRELLTILPR